VLFKNSWGKRFGTNGFAWLERRHFDLRVDAFAAQLVEESGDTEDSLLAP
jgi:C1A family cysteine protease